MKLKSKTILQAIVVALLCIAFTAFAASSFTPNYNLEMPAAGDTGWADALNSNTMEIDEQMFINQNSTQNHIDDAVGAHAATAISTTVGLVCTSALTVQAYLACLDNELNTLVTGAAVTINTDQTIIGQKTFSAETLFTGGIDVIAGSITTPFSTGLVHSDASGVLSSSLLVNADVDASAAIAYSKLDLADSIVDADVNSAAAIAGTKISPDFGAQNVVTTGDIDGDDITAGGTVSGVDASFSDDITLTAPEYDNLKIGEKLVQARSTGLLTGGLLSIDTDTTKFDLSAGTGMVLDYTASPATIKNVSWSAFNAQTVTGLASQDQTFILIDNTGAIVQQSTFPTPTQRRSNIFIGRLSHSSRTTIGTALSEPDFVYGLGSQFYDLLDSLGRFNVSGNVVTANGANLKINRSAGILFSRASDYSANSLDPHEIPTSSATQQTFRYNTQTQSLTSLVSDIDVANYDNAGTVTAVGGGTNSSTVQRVYIFPTGAVRIQYGQAVYGNLADAVAAINSEIFNVNPILRDGATLIAYIAVTRTATNLSNPSQAKIIIAGKFGTTPGGAAGVTSLQQAYNVSAQPQITVNSTQGGVQVFDASTPIAADLFEVANNAGTTEFLKVDVNGAHTTSLKIQETGGGSDKVTINTPSIASSYTITLPVDDGNANQVLGTNGSGVTSWVDATSGYSQNSDTTLTASDTIAIGTGNADRLQHWRVAGNSGPVTLSSTPFGTSNPQDRTIICLAGTSDANTVTIEVNDAADGVVGNGNVTLGQYESACFRYLSTEDRYIIESRSN